MGGTQSAEGHAGPNPGASTVVVDSDKPYFFLASCPDDSVREAIGLADQYGGFHCIGDGNDGFEAWKGRAAGQFLTLKRLSPAGRKVVGIAIAGFGHCNDEREFLGQLHKKKGHEQFVLKQCGDVRDMERWLRSEGYAPSAPGEAVAGPPPEEAARTRAAPEAGPAGVWASVTQLFGASGAAPEAWKERWLMDVQHAEAEAEGVDAAGPEALSEAAERLAAALRHAREAGVPEADLEAPAARLEELQRLRAAAERRGFLSCWCCCTEAPGGPGRVEEPQETRVPLAGGCTDSLAGLGARNDRREVELQQKASAQMKTVLPGQAQSGGPLPAGTRCRYRSPRSGWIDAVVEGFNESDGTCNLDVKKHAKPESIFPAANITEAQAWPVGTLVEYESSTAGHWLEATICAFNGGIAGSESTYNLDVRDRAAVDRIRLRLA